MCSFVAIKFKKRLGCKQISLGYANIGLFIKKT